MGFDDSKSREYQLCPSILSADFNRLGEQIQMLERAGVKWLHSDGWRLCTQHFFWNASH